MANLPQTHAQTFPAGEGGGAETADDPLRILVVDDEPNVRDVLRDVCSRFGHLVTACNGGKEAIAEASRQQFDAAFVDLKMPGMNGSEVLKALRRLLPAATFVMITAYAESELVDESLENGAFICLSKPLSIAEIGDLLRGLAEGGQDAWALPEEVEQL